MGRPLSPGFTFIWHEVRSDVHRSTGGYNGTLTLLGTLRAHADLVWTPGGKLRRVYLTDGSFERVGAR